MKKPSPTEPSPASQLTGFIAKFDAPNARLIRACRVRMRKLLPGAFELVYDNYNFFVIGYGPTERPSEAVLSIAAAAHGVGMSFLHGADLPDPTGRLIGSGKQNRFIRLPTAATLDEPEVLALIRAAVGLAVKPFAPAGGGRLIIRSISAKQRPRRKTPPE